MIMQKVLCRKRVLDWLTNEQQQQQTQTDKKTNTHKNTKMSLVAPQINNHYDYLRFGYVGS